ncbi:hypothetical protein EDB19DRAFT_1831382 [Suillus lakei]|nr:hypothetical protein EDB19DRAFT_1831382 [Suillus lakei]
MSRAALAGPQLDLECLARGGEEKGRCCGATVTTESVMPRTAAWEKMGAVVVGETDSHLPRTADSTCMRCIKVFVHDTGSARSASDQPAQSEKAKVTSATSASGNIRPGEKLQLDLHDWTVSRSDHLESRATTPDFWVSVTSPLICLLRYYTCYGHRLAPRQGDQCFSLHRTLPSSLTLAGQAIVFFGLTDTPRSDANGVVVDHWSRQGLAATHELLFLQILSAFRSTTLMPHTKLLRIRTPRSPHCKSKVYLVGDGTNDGPALSCPEIVLTVAAGSDLRRDVLALHRPLWIALLGWDR